MNVEISQKKKREEKLHGARDESDLKRQLAEIEKAAHSALQDDRKMVGSIFASSSSSSSSLSHHQQYQSREKKSDENGTTDDLKSSRKES